MKNKYKVMYVICGFIYIIILNYPDIKSGLTTSNKISIIILCITHLFCCFFIFFNVKFYFYEKFYANIFARRRSPKRF